MKVKSFLIKTQTNTHERIERKYPFVESSHFMSVVFPPLSLKKGGKNRMKKKSTLCLAHDRKKIEVYVLFPFPPSTLPTRAFPDHVRPFLPLRALPTRPSSSARSKHFLWTRHCLPLPLPPPLRTAVPPRLPPHLPTD